MSSLCASVSGWAQAGTTCCKAEAERTPPTAPSARLGRQACILQVYELAGASNPCGRCAAVLCTPPTPTTVQHSLGRPSLGWVPAPSTGQPHLQIATSWPGVTPHPHPRRCQALQPGCGSWPHPAAAQQPTSAPGGGGGVADTQQQGQSAEYRQTFDVMTHPPAGCSWYLSVWVRHTQQLLVHQGPSASGCARAAA